MKNNIRITIACILLLRPSLTLAIKQPLLNDTIKTIDTYLTQLSAAQNFSGGILIVKGTKIILNKGYGFADKENHIAFTSNTLGSIGSITKAFTAAAIMKLYQQGKLQLHDSLNKFFPAAPPDKAAITVHQLLTHSAGFSEFLNEDQGDYEVINTADFLKRAFKQELAFKPGTKAVYTNVGYSILGIIIEQLSGQEYEHFLKEQLLKPSGINTIGYHYPALPSDTIAVGYRNGQTWGTHPGKYKEAGGGPYWNLKANGGLEASLNDIARWVNSFSTHSILPDSLIKKMFSPHIMEEGMNGQYYFGYGCNISKSRRNTKVIDNGGSNGIYFARLLRLPEDDVVFYVITNESSMNANMVLPNITQLYFYGKIDQDAIHKTTKFENEIAAKIYELTINSKNNNLEIDMMNSKIEIQDDMPLLEVGQALMQENKLFEAIKLYDYYNAKFPNIVVAWNDKGDVYNMLKNKDAALKCYQQALKIRPQNIRALEAIKKLEN